MNDLNIDKIILNNDIENKIQKCVEFVKLNDLNKINNGSHEIDGSDIFVNIFQMTTADPKDRAWEAHKVYIDLHYLIQGNEQLHINDLKNMSIEDYDDETDSVILNGPKKDVINLSEGDFYLCMPNDAHKTGVISSKSEYIKKAVFKIKI